METVTLISNDNVNFTISEEVANKFVTVKNLIEDLGVNESIPLTEGNSNILRKIIKYTKYHIENPSNKDENLTSWDNEFLNTDNETLFDIILTANYLEYKDLLNDACQKVADIIKGKTVEQIRKYFDIQNDFSPEEEQEIEKENQWYEE